MGTIGKKHGNVRQCIRGNWRSKVKHSANSSTSVRDWKKHVVLDCRRVSIFTSQSYPKSVLQITLGYHYIIIIYITRMMDNSKYTELTPRCSPCTTCGGLKRSTSTSTDFSHHLTSNVCIAWCPMDSNSLIHDEPFHAISRILGFLSDLRIFSPISRRIGAIFQLSPKHLTSQDRAHGYGKCAAARPAVVVKVARNWVILLVSFVHTWSIYGINMDDWW